MEIGATHGARAHAHQDLTRPGPRDGEIGGLERAAAGAKHHRAHGKRRIMPPAFAGTRIVSQARRVSLRGAPALSFATRLATPFPLLDSGECPVTRRAVLLLAGLAGVLTVAATPARPPSV